MQTYYISWDVKLKISIKELYDTETATDKNIYNLLVKYIKDNNKNRFVDIEPIIYLYNKYHSNLVKEYSIKICDETYKFKTFGPIDTIQIRDEIRFKMCLKTLYSSVKRIIKDKFNIRIIYEFEKHSDVYKSCKDYFVANLESITQKEVSYNKKYRIHDCLFTLTNGNDKFQIACEYNERSHSNEYDDNRKVSLKIPLVSLFVRKQGETQQNISQYIKQIINDIVYKCCALSDDNTYVAKLLMWNQLDEEQFELMTTLLNCIHDDYFDFLTLNTLFSLDQCDQEEIKQLLIEKGIMNTDNEEDDNKTTSYITEEGDYYFDNIQFEKFILLMNTDLSCNYTNILSIYVKGQKALLQATKMLLEKEKTTKVDTDNIKSFIKEITLNPIKEILNKYNNEIATLECYKKAFGDLKLKSHSIVKNLPYFKYKKGNNITEQDLIMIKNILGKNFEKSLIKTIDLMNQSREDKIIFHQEVDELIDNTKIENVEIDYCKMFEYHFLH